MKLLQARGFHRKLPLTFAGPLQRLLGRVSAMSLSQSDNDDSDETKRSTGEASATRKRHSRDRSSKMTSRYFMNRKPGTRHNYKVARPLMLWLMISSLRPLAAEWSGYGCKPAARRTRSASLLMTQSRSDRAAE
jgi:hypothetical protein